MENKDRPGYILTARKIVDSEIWQKPATWYKLWHYILMEVNYETKLFPRGTGLFRWKVVSKEVPETSSDVWYKCLKWLRATGMATVRKTVRGIVITVLNYEQYQEPKNYKTVYKTVRSAESRRNGDGMEDGMIPNAVNASNTVNAVRGVQQADTLTPKQKALKFFTEPATQELVKGRLAQRGIPTQVAEQELKKFISYWTELNPTGSKQRWQMEKTFEINGRLGRWFANLKNFKSGTETLEQANLETKRRQEQEELKSKMQAMQATPKASPEVLAKLRDKIKTIGRPI